MTPITPEEFVKAFHDQMFSNKEEFLKIKKDFKTEQIDTLIHSVCSNAMLLTLVHSPMTVLKSVYVTGILIGRLIEQNKKEVEELHKLYVKGQTL